MRVWLPTRCPFWIHLLLEYGASQC
jgi:hypothetical protein